MTTKPIICTIDGCDAVATVKGLCAKHYMRLRRHGDASTVKSAGRPRDARKVTMAQLFPELSPRTQHRYAMAMGVLGWLKANTGEDAYQRVFDAATRVNGSVNVSKLLTLAKEAARPVLIRKLKAEAAAERRRKCSGAEPVQRKRDVGRSR
jgi:hypothetical protein